LDFRDKFVEIFGEPDMATTRLHELRRSVQQIGESVSEYMNRLRILVLKAHDGLSHKNRERFIVSNFTLGLRDKNLSTALMMASVKNSAEAERKAVESESARANARIKRAYANFLPDESEQQVQQDYSESQYERGGPQDGYDNNMAAFGTQRGGRGGPARGGFFRVPRGGRGRGGGRGNCFNCGESGRFRAECPYPQESSTFPKPKPSPQGPSQCPL
jgi:hypothetical protein